MAGPFRDALFHLYLRHTILPLRATCLLSATEMTSTTIPDRKNSEVEGALS